MFRLHSKTTALALLLFSPLLLSGVLAPQPTDPGAQTETSHTDTALVRDVIVHSNAPAALDPAKPTRLIFYALPNGNSIQWTAGKLLKEGDDWHFDIQHIAAQTRWLRQYLPGYNIVTVYLANRQKSWPAWKRLYPAYPQLTDSLIRTVSRRYAAYRPEITLSSHSGGGSFIFGYLDGQDTIPAAIRRIVFIDSSYGYESKYAPKLCRWLKGGKRYLCNLAYNDSVVIYNGKPLVSPTGGTWYRSKLMISDLERSVRFTHKNDTAFRRATALGGRIQFHLKENPGAKIYHTEQVARNGFIFSQVSGTADEKRLKVPYWGKWVYRDMISADTEDTGF